MENLENLLNRFVGFIQSGPNEQEIELEIRKLIGLITGEEG